VPQLVPSLPSTTTRTLRLPHPRWIVTSLECIVCRVLLRIIIRRIADLAPKERSVVDPDMVLTGYKRYSTDIQRYLRVMKSSNPHLTDQVQCNSEGAE
jgi:hypothetical protein